MDTRQTVVVVTGAGSGMGRETALLFSQKDYTIVGVDINEATLKETIERTGQNKDKALGIPADVTKVEELKTVAEKLRARFGRLDILINCVGQFGSTKGLLELSDEDIERIMDVNLKSTYRTCKYLLPLMVENKRGLIINIGSKAGKLAHGVAGGIYAAAKWGVNGFSKSLDLELRRKYNIKVCVINPGTTNTPFHDRRGKRLDSSLLEKFLDPKDIARACLFIAEQSDKCVIEEIDLVPSLETVEVVLR